VKRRVRNRENYCIYSVTKNKNVIAMHWGKTRDSFNRTGNTEIMEEHIKMLRCRESNKKGKIGEQRAQEQLQ
jgi:hypothetical protein